MTNSLVLKESQTWNSEVVNELVEASHMLSEMLNNTLDMSKLEEGKVEFNKKYESIQNVMESILRIVKPNAIKKRVEVNANYDKSLPPLLELDRSRVTQIIMNLLGNAIKFTPMDGNVTLNVKWYPKVLSSKSLNLNGVLNIDNLCRKSDKVI